MTFPQRLAIGASTGLVALSFVASAAFGAIVYTPVITSEIANGAITTAKIANGAVTNAKLASNAVTGAKIATGTVTASDLAASSVGSSEIVAGAVGSSEIATGAVGSDEVATNSLQDVDLGADSVGASEIIEGQGFTFATVNTGFGANELYDMDQNVLTTSDVTFDDLFLTGTLDVTGTSTLGVLNVGGDATFSGRLLGAFGDVTVGYHSVPQDFRVWGTSVLAGDTEIGRSWEPADLRVWGNFDVTGTSTLGILNAGSTTLADLLVWGDTDLWGTLDVTGTSTLGILNVWDDANFYDYATFWSDLLVWGDTDLMGDLDVTGTSTLGLLNAGATTLGALDADAANFDTVNTGFGDNELYDMDQNVLTTSDVAFDDLDLTGTLDVGDAATFSASLTANGALTANAALTANGTLTANGALTATGAVDFSGASSLKMPKGVGLAAAGNCAVVADQGKLYFATTTAGAMTSGTAYVCTSDADANGTHDDYAWEALN